MDSPSDGPRRRSQARRPAGPGPDGRQPMPGDRRGPEPGARRRPARPPHDGGPDGRGFPRGAEPRPGEPGSPPPRARRQPPPEQQRRRAADPRDPRRRAAADPRNPARRAAGDRRAAPESVEPAPTRPRRPGEPRPVRRTSGEIHTRPAPNAKKKGKPAPRAQAAEPKAGPKPGPKPGRRRDPATVATPTKSAATAAAPATPPTTPPSGTPRTGGRLSGAGWGRALIAVASVAVLLCTGYAWNTMSDLQTRITQLGGLDLGGAEDGAVDILLVGTDSRTDAKGNPLSPEELRLLRSGDEVATNTDTILLIRIPDDGSSATAISIPRDSYVDVPGIGMSKINAAYGTTRESVRARAVGEGRSEGEAESEGTLAGRKALVDTVANLTGVQVDHYAEVGLLGFVLLTNAAGGIDVCLNDAVRDPYSGARFKAGRQTLNGPKALSFVRQRHGLPRGDLDRITRQQAFMASLTQKILSAGTLTDPGKLSELQNAVSRSVVIDDDWDIIRFAEQLKDLSGGRVKFATIPIVTEQGWSEDGQQSVVEVDPREVQTFTGDLLAPKESKGIQRGDYTVDVVNAGTIDGLASNVANILTNKGFRVGATSSGKADTRDSIVYAKDDNEAARVLAKDLGGARVVADPALADDRFKVVLTNTYAGPGSISDTGDQTDNTPASERVGNKRPPITAGNEGPMCVN
ncbi:LCP family glycopolymer transferase [Gordonia sp. KTR9]|uniref:LCP family glycopolymer transferase n=1 Tax=Gordonia sp. KTR9 TaxID=337191 RepID=UPI00027DD855|nr:LCP family protein [Gordonia sp. KTR9]AFR48428.1 Transcriptional regulator [Gordonia sp. KTR9]